MKTQPCIIGFEHFQISCIIGVEPEERIHEQDLFVDIRVESDIAKCVSTDSIADTIDYVGLSKICEYVAQSGSYFLLETYANAVLDAILTHQKINWAWIRVKKPSALPGANFSIVEMEKGVRSCRHGH